MVTHMERPKLWLIFVVVHCQYDPLLVVAHEALIYWSTKEQPLFIRPVIFRLDNC